MLNIELSLLNIEQLLDILSFCCIFAHKFKNKINYFQMKNVEKKELDICVYYKDLSKKDKGRLVAYLIQQYGMNYSTIIAKLNGRHKMNTLEEITISNVIRDDLWRK